MPYRTLDQVAALTDAVLAESSPFPALADMTPGARLMMENEAANNGRSIEAEHAAQAAAATTRRTAARQRLRLDPRPDGYFDAEAIVEAARRNR